MIPALDYFAQYVKFLCYLLFCLFEKTIEYDLVFFFYFLLPVSPPHSQLTRYDLWPSLDTQALASKVTPT